MKKFNLLVRRQKLYKNIWSAIMNKAFLALFLFIFIFHFNLFSQANSNPLFPVKVAGKCGFIDINGKIVIPLQFDDVQAFEDDLAIIFKDGKSGAIDKNGNIVVENKYDILTSFSEGLAGFYDESAEKWGFIDKNGNVIIEPKFYEIGSFSEGLCPVATQKLSITRNYDSSESEIEEILVWSCIDKKGNFTFQNLSVVINYRKFKNGLIPVFDREAKRYGYINKKGDYEIDPIFTSAKPFSEGLACVSDEYYRYGYIDKKGKYVIEPRFLDAYSFSEGFAAVKNNEDKWGYINREGIFIIQPKFDGFLYESDFIRSFSDGYAAFAEKGKCGYIDNLGNQVIPPTWDRAEDFVNGLAEVYQRVSVWNEDLGPKDDPEAYEMQDVFIGYIDKSGNFIWKQPE